jgi:hypothetical protein
VVKPSLYKCAQCKVPAFCSAQCQVTHKGVCAPRGEAICVVQPSAAHWHGERGDDGRLVILGERHLVALRSSNAIRGPLKSGELQDIIRRIDGSRCRLDALDAALHNVPEFREFCEVVLTTVHAADEVN